MDNDIKSVFLRIYVWLCNQRKFSYKKDSMAKGKLECKWPLLDGHNDSERRNYSNQETKKRDSAHLIAIDTCFIKKFDIFDERLTLFHLTNDFSAFLQISQNEK